VYPTTSNGRPNTKLQKSFALFVAPIISAMMRLFCNNWRDIKYMFIIGSAETISFSVICGRAQKVTIHEFNS
jgi:hypothetical protein